MQAQRAGARRFKFNPMMVLALAAGILLAVAVLAANDVIDPPFTSESETASITASSDVDLRRQQYIEQKFQLPDVYLANPARSVEHMRFLEQNLYLPTGRFATHALSVDRMIFLEQNIWEYGGLPDESADRPSPTRPTNPANPIP